MEKISISEMAKLHGISRQTLIYYDKIGLFKPELVDSNGYRYYSWRQIPLLREICFLKEAGMPLKEIVERLGKRTIHGELESLLEQKKRLEHQIGELNRLREAVSMRIHAYITAEEAMRMENHEPFLMSYPERKVIFKEYIRPIMKENLHKTLMKLMIETSVSKELIPSGYFGSILKKDSLLNGKTDEEILDGAGSCIFVPHWEKNIPGLRLIPHGEYACLFTYHMPYEIREAKELLKWIHSQNMELCGDIVDICLLDTTFYNKDIKKDFCLIQAPVKHKK